MLYNSVVVTVVVVTCMRPQAILLAMIAIRKSINGFPFLSYMSMVPPYMARVTQFSCEI